jgi:hypothetical protein
MEYRRWLDELNVLVKESRQTIFSRAHKDITVLAMVPYADSYTTTRVGNSVQKTRSKQL